MGLLCSSGAQYTLEDTINSQEKFSEIIKRERARSDRNGHGFSIVKYEVKESEINNPCLQKVLCLLPERIRLTDEIGWVDHDHIGVLLYASTLEDARSFARQIEESVRAEGVSMIRYSIYTYPSSADGYNMQGGDRDSFFQEQGPQKEPDLILTANSRILKWKRCVDIAGASFGLLLCSPVFLLMAIFIKTMSPDGPVFFKQERIGYGGKPFMFWKFRTMNVNADTTAHQKLLAELIKDDSNTQGQGKVMTKLDHDPQIIPFGNILRKTCIDELPQFINVLLGDMSLIGPRPPIPYEVDEYDRWHKERLATVPGMTGLWQVSGKNKLTFKQMVRLDIRYLRQQSLWHDIKILFSTPKAIVSQVKDIL